MDGWCLHLWGLSMSLSMPILGEAVGMAGWPYPALFLVGSFVKFPLGSALIVLGLITLPAVDLVRRVKG